MKKKKPTIYEIIIIINWEADWKYYGNARELKWGWHNLQELAEMAGIPAKELLYRFIDFKAKRFFAPFHTHTGFDKMKLGIIVQSLNNDPAAHKKCYELNWYDRHDLFRKNEFCQNDIISTETLNVIVNHESFVPAGWGLAVLEEVKKNPPSRKATEDKGEKNA